MTLREWSVAYARTMWSQARLAYRLLKTAIYPGLVLADETSLETSGGRSDGREEVKATPKQLLDLYDLDVWVFACALRKAERLADIPWVLKREVKSGKDEVVTDHPARDFLYEHGDKVWEESALATSVWSNLCGRAYWKLLKDEGSEWPTGIQWLLPHLVKPVITAGEGVVAYKYQPNAGKPNSSAQEFPADEVVWFRSFCPVEEFGYASPAKAAWIASQLDINTQRWNEAFFKRGGTLRTLLSARPGEKIPRDERDRIIKDLQNKSRGQENWQGEYFIPHGVEINRTGATHREMEFGKLSDDSRLRICAAFGVPPVWVGIETANYATAQVQERVALEGVILPEWRRMAAKITHEILPHFPESEGLYVAVDMAELRIPGEEAERRNGVIAEKQAGIITVAEARATLGHEIDVKGDERDPEDDVLPEPSDEEQRLADEQRAAQGDGGGGAGGGAADGGDPPAALAARNRGLAGANGNGNGKGGGKGNGAKGGGKTMAKAAYASGWKPAAATRGAARLGLKLAEAHGRGSTERALALAKRLADGEAIAARDLRRMANWHERHADDREIEKAETRDVQDGFWGSEPNPSPGWIAFLLRGGSAGAAWALACVEEAEEARA